MRVRVRVLVSLLVTVLLAVGEARAEYPTLLGKLELANFNTTADQAISLRADRYIIRRIPITNCTASLTVAAGGVYTGASKTGIIIVAAAQVYTALTGGTKFIDATLASGVTGDHLTSATVFLSLTTGQGSPVTCDVYIYGDPLP